ncbi:MAG: hypothetical protein OQJ89_05860 [Kangiellaceae bacterium]|nr:hypothetical protein [Kangiellaceae bacterium]MCW9016467.1 hypothetical protein [Kangiellaceae bacterium]
MRIITLASLLLLLTGCFAKQRVKTGESFKPLKENEGYLGLVIDSLDSLRSIQIRNVDKDEEFYVGNAGKGFTQITLRLEEGEYCFVGFDVYNLRVDFTDRGFCTYVEAGEVNYFGHFIVRDPVTNSHPNFPHYLRLLRKDHPEICEQYIGGNCKI